MMPKPLRKCLAAPTLDNLATATQPNDSLPDFNELVAACARKDYVLMTELVSQNPSLGPRMAQVFPFVLKNDSHAHKLEALIKKRREPILEVDGNISSFRARASAVASGTMGRSEATGIMRDLEQWIAELLAETLLLDVELEEPRRQLVQLRLRRSLLSQMPSVILDGNKSKTLELQRRLAVLT